MHTSKCISHPLGKLTYSPIILGENSEGLSSATNPEPKGLP